MLPVHRPDYIAFEERPHPVHHAVRGEEDQGVPVHRIAKLGGPALDPREYAGIFLHLVVLGCHVVHVHYETVLFRERRRVGLCHRSGGEPHGLNVLFQRTQSPGHVHSSVQPPHEFRNVCGLHACGVEVLAVVARLYGFDIVAAGRPQPAQQRDCQRIDVRHFPLVALRKQHGPLGAYVGHVVYGHVEALVAYAVFQGKSLSEDVVFHHLFLFPEFQLVSCRLFDYRLDLLQEILELYALSYGGGPERGTFIDGSIYHSYGYPEALLLPRRIDYIVGLVHYDDDVLAFRVHVPHESVTDVV